MAHSHKEHMQGFATRAIHAGDIMGNTHGALVPPVYMSSTFVFENVEQGAARFEGAETGHFYSRVSNPTLDILERRFAAIAGAEAALACASGMGAITSTFWSLLETGDEVVVSKTLYGCTFAFLEHGLTKFGVKIRSVDMSNLDSLQSAMSHKVKCIFFETPSNPNMGLVDIREVSKIAKEYGALTIVDNTYCTPYLSRPIELGADLTVHSATKYLGGHGDLVGGMVAGSQELLTQIRLEGLKDMTGAVMSPLTAHQIMRGLKTLELRMDRHCETAQLIAETLEVHPEVDRVYYPGLESFPQHDLAKQQMLKPGGMIAFEVKGGKQAGIAVMNALTLIKRAVSLGDPDSLIQHPASMTHSAYTEEERKAHGISEGLIRLSVGLESPQDILDDIDKGLAAIKTAPPIMSLAS